VSDDDTRARDCAEVMWRGDRASRQLGMVIEEVAAGRSRVSMPVREDMVNGWDICHGAFIAALADSAFALACNTYDDVTVASGFEIEFLEPARLGDRLDATATERSRRGRSGLYDVTVTRFRAGAEPAVCAEFRGRSRSLGRAILDA
jgi:acyl-CoA thioesterase